MEILIFAALCAAAVAAIGIGAFAASRMAMKEKKAPEDIVQASAVSEWDRLAKRHDPAKRLEEAAASSDAYRELADVHRELLASLPGSMQLRIRLADEASFRNYDVETDFFQAVDLDERRQYAGWAAARRDAWARLRDRIDHGCAMGATEEDPASCNVCLDMADRIYKLLDTGLTLLLEAPASDGVHVLKDSRRIPEERIAAMAGEPFDGGNEDILARYAVLKSAGFRCALCGRSPVSGGTLHACKDPVTGRDTCLCGGCAGKP